MAAGPVPPGSALPFRGDAFAAFQLDVGFADAAIDRDSRLAGAVAPVDVASEQPLARPVAARGDQVSLAHPRFDRYRMDGRLGRGDMHLAHTEIGGDVAGDAIDMQLADAEIRLHRKLARRGDEGFDPEAAAPAHALRYADEDSVPRAVGRDGQLLRPLGAGGEVMAGAGDADLYLQILAVGRGDLDFTDGNVESQGRHPGARKSLGEGADDLIPVGAGRQGDRGKEDEDEKGEAAHGVGSPKVQGSLRKAGGRSSKPASNAQGNLFAAPAVHRGDAGLAVRSPSILRKERSSCSIRLADPSARATS